MHPIEFRLRSIQGERNVRFVSQTEPSWKTEKDNPFAGKIKKRSLIHGRVNVNYTKAVNDDRVAHGLPSDFVASKRKWGERIDGTPIIEHKGERYVEVVVDHVVWTNFVHVVSDTIVPKDLFESYLKVSPLHQTIAVRDFKLGNIHWLELI